MDILNVCVFFFYAVGLCIGYVLSYLDYLCDSTTLSLNVCFSYVIYMSIRIMKKFWKRKSSDSLLQVLYWEEGGKKRPRRRGEYGRGRTTASTHRKRIHYLLELLRGQSSETTLPDSRSSFSFWVKNSHIHTNDNFISFYLEFARF
jgi:hypothetical protein